MTSLKQLFVKLSVVSVLCFSAVHAAPPPAKLIEEANSGNANAQVEVANHYLSQGKEDDKAFLYYELAAKQGNAAGIFLIGWMYDFGRSVPKNRNIALYHYEKAALMGQVDALYHVGMGYYNGHGYKQNLDKAEEFLLQAAEQNHIHALYYMGHLEYLKSKRGEKDNFQAAINYFKRAVALNNSSAYTYLGHIYFNGEHTSPRAPDYKLALEYYMEADKRDNKAAQLTLGNLYLGGTHVTQNYQTAREYFMKSANIKSVNDPIYTYDKNSAAEGLIRLGEMAANGLGQPQDYYLADDYYSKAIEQVFNHTYANYLLGQLHELGVARFAKPKTALSFYEHSCRYGFKNACADYNRLNYELYRSKDTSDSKN